ncbi:hypothetical protein ACQ4PT_037100 [Festuca glaucescens]
MASEPLAMPPPIRRSIPPTTTTATITTTGGKGTTTTVSAATKGTTTTTTIVSTTANGTTITTTTTTSNAITTSTSTSIDTTISSLSEDDLCEIFLRLPDLPALVRATLTCRSWLGVVRSSLAFRRLFRALHPAPIIGLFLTGDTYPFFIPLRPSDSDSDSNPGCDSDVTAALRRGDFFLTSLPQSFSGWTITDCRDGIILLWNKLDNNDLSLAT